MKPIDFRNETFEQIRARLNKDREAVHRAWLAQGPGTTREVSARSGIELLTFRPRSTELFQMGLLVVSDKCGHEGVYSARSVADWLDFVAHQQSQAAAGQLQLV